MEAAHRPCGVHKRVVREVRSGVPVVIALGLVLILASSPRLFPESGTVTVAWDPSPDPSVVGYLVYVGTQSRHYTETFDVGLRTSFVYRRPLASATYYFAVASYAAGPRVGPPSEEVSTAVSVQDPPRFFEPLPWTIDTRLRAPAVVVPTGSLQRSTVLAHTALPVHVLHADARGRIWFVEGRGSIRILDRSLVRTVLVAPDAEREFMGLATRPAAPTGTFVYVGEVSTRGGWARQLEIVRYREIQGVLGERSVLVSELLLPRSLGARMAIDEEGRIHVAMPAADDTVSSRDRAYAGMVLGFTPDGRAAGMNGSPVLAPGLAAPAGLEVLGNALWLAGASEAGIHLVMRRPFTSGAAATFAAVATPPAPVHALGTEDTHGSLLVAAAGQLFRMRVEDLELLPLAGAIGRVLAVASTPSGAIVASVSEADGHRILQLD